MNTKKTNFFIVGAPKCGTTSMYHWLKQHSQIYFPEIKETHFFSTDLHPNKRAIKTLDEYLELYKKSDDSHKVLGDASVFYLYSKDAVKNILAFNRDAKFLVMLRNPIDMVTSLHLQYLYSGNEIYKDFEKAWIAKDSRIENVGITRITEDPQLLNYGEVCKLGRQTERLLESVSREKVMFILLDDLKDSPDSQLIKLFSFLNIREEKIECSTWNKASERKYPRLHRALKYVNKVKKDLEIKNLNTGLGGYLKRFNTTEAEKKGITDLMRKELKEFFKRDIEIIENVLDRDLKRWHE